MNTYLKDLISIIIPSYDRYEMLLHSIQSVLDSEYKNVEIIVVNDCSTDQRYYNKKLESFEKTKVIHLSINQRIKYNIGAAQGMTRQEGLNIATGEYIAFLDDDDFCTKDRLRLQIEYMKNNNCLFTCGNMYLVNHKSISEEKLDIDINSMYFQPNTLPSIITYNISRSQNLICNSTVMMHKSLIDKVGSFRVTKCWEDLDYWQRALEFTECHYLDIPFCYYTVQMYGGEHKKEYTYDFQDKKDFGEY